MKKQPIKDQRLAELESEFRALLISCLEQCAGGRWGLFGHKKGMGVGDHLPWEEGDRVMELAREIQTLRLEFGQPSPIVERFFYYRSLRGCNVPGEPKLAKAFLDEIKKGDFETP
jgi:hypothetical protein